VRCQATVPVPCLTRAGDVEWSGDRAKAVRAAALQSQPIALRADAKAYRFISGLPRGACTFSVGVTFGAAARAYIGRNKFTLLDPQCPPI